MSKRLDREFKTARAMVRLYCRDHHGNIEDLCSDCQELLDYVSARLDKCPYQENKPTCSKCPVHCYKPAMRDKVRNVMRYAGPRMLKHHTVMALRHLLDGFKKSPAKP